MPQLKHRKKYTISVINKRRSMRLRLSLFIFSVISVLGNYCYSQNGCDAPPPHLQYFYWGGCSSWIATIEVAYDENFDLYQNLLLTVERKNSSGAWIYHSTISTDEYAVT